MLVACWLALIDINQHERAPRNQPFGQQPAGKINQPVQPV
jgi:hypothetical protein